MVKESRQAGPLRVHLVHRLWNARDARWMVLQTIGYSNPDGALSGFSQDISASRENEETLRRYRNLLVTSGLFGKICYWTLDYAEGGYQISDDLAEQLGFPPRHHAHSRSGVQLPHPPRRLGTSRRHAALGHPRSGIIEPLGAWVIGEACRQVMAWSAHGLPALSVSVNCSARQFLAPMTLLDTVRRALAETGLPAGQLEHEITESMIVQDVTKMQWLLGQFRELGVRIAIDDFGTGYSSLAYLKRLPLDRLKIDRSFVRDIETDPDDLTIAATVANLGRSLGLKVTAEGVETYKQLQLLQAMQCDEGQGYFWGKPMPAEAFVAWMQAHHPGSKRPV